MDSKFRLGAGLMPIAAGFLLAAALPGMAFQAPPPSPNSEPATPPRQVPKQRVGGFVPGQARPKEDPVRVAHGKTLYDVNCRVCHGADLRGGDMGGPSLLRSQVTLSDKAGELIVPIIHGSRKSMGMPAIGISDDDAGAVAGFVRSVVGTIGVQGTPPEGSREAPNALVGNAKEGQIYFAAKCGTCHSPTGDMAGVGSRISDPKTLQTRWVGAGRRNARRNVAGPETPPATVSIAAPEGPVAGDLVHIDDFLVTVRQADGTVRSFRRDGDSPKVDVRDPIEAHRKMLGAYSDKDIHDVTAYLVTLK